MVRFLRPLAVTFQWTTPNCIYEIWGSVSKIVAVIFLLGLVEKRPHIIFYLLI